MAARLGNVLYWLCCGLAVIFVILATIAALVFTGIVGNSAEEGVHVVLAVIFAGASMTSWLVGRALKFGLAGT